MSRKTLQLISQNLVTLKEYLHLHTAGCHHHLHFCLIWMALHNLQMKLCWWKEESICVSDIKSASIFLLIICYRESNLFRREFMLSCAKISLLMFYDVYFPKLYEVQRKLLYTFYFLETTKNLNNRPEDL